jgi:hypothetical protein
VHPVFFFLGHAGELHIIILRRIGVKNPNRGFYMTRERSKPQDPPWQHTISPEKQIQTTPDQAKTLNPWGARARS